MADLIAQGPQPNQRWRKRLPASTSIVLGRTCSGWSVPWDEHVSRRHVELVWSGAKLVVQRLAEARNPLYFAGASCDQCSVRPGEVFVLGGTTFTLVDEPVTIVADAPAPAVEHTFTLDVLQRSAFRDANQRLAVLTRLPEVLSGDISDEELCAKLVSLLLAGIPLAAFVAVVSCCQDSRVDAPEVLHWDDRGGHAAALTTSERLIRQALHSGLSVAHIWSPSTSDSSYTQAESVTWAYCTPIRHAASQDWCVYIAGSHDAEGNAPEYATLQDDVKFTELIADTIGRVRELRRLERRQATLGQFVSPVVLERLGHEDPAGALAPRETEVSVIFCDLRGFTRAAERAAHDLMTLLKRVSQALGVMTQHILQSGGVIGDFHGDAAMGFWGWPFDQPDRILRVCNAALAISAEFTNAAARPDHSLAGFRIGIGIASGRAVAGKIGSSDQVKITVFGPVVNLAARLQDLTKVLRAPILLDENTAQAVRDWTGTPVGRLRRVARVRPRGLESPLLVSELLPAPGMSAISEQDIATYENALAALNQGDFERSFALLHGVSAEDRVKDFLTVFIAQHHRQAPANWNGVIDLQNE